MDDTDRAAQLAADVGNLATLVAKTNGRGEIHSIETCIAKLPAATCRTAMEKAAWNQELGRSWMKSGRQWRDIELSDGSNW